MTGTWPPPRVDFPLDMAAIPSGVYPVHMGQYLVKPDGKRIVATILLLASMLLAIPGRGDAETRTVFWGAVTAYTDGTPIEPTRTVTYDVFWTTDIALSPASLHLIAGGVAQTSATFDADAQGIPRGQPVYFTGNAILNTGEKSALSPPYTWNVPTLSSIAISGPSSVNENGSGTYTAAATWSDSSTTGVTPTWTENSPYASIGTSGVLTTLAVDGNQLVTVTASYISGGVTRSASRSVTIVNVAATLSGIAVTGPSSVNEGATGSYVATGTWSDGSTSNVTSLATWSTTLGTISGGVLTAPSVTANQTATVTASYASGGPNRTASQTVTIMNVPPLPAAPMNMYLTGPVQTSPVTLFRLGWDPVAMYTDGTPIGTVAVSYAAYWTTDDTLSVGSLRSLAGSIPGTSVTFDPAAEGMAQNQRVYLTARAILGTGQQSALAGALSWVAINQGPVAPSNPTIMRR